MDSCSCRWTFWQLSSWTTKKIDFFSICHIFIVFDFVLLFCSMIKIIFFTLWKIISNKKQSKFFFWVDWFCTKFGLQKNTWQIGLQYKFCYTKIIELILVHASNLSYIEHVYMTHFFIFIIESYRFITLYSLWFLSVVQLQIAIDTYKHCISYTKYQYRNHWKDLIN